MRPLPADIAALIRPIPADFTINFEECGWFVRWAAILTIEGHGPMQVELGYSMASGKADEAKERINLRARAWQCMELARLGRADLLAYASVDRHKRNRTINRPLIAAG